MQSLYPFFFTFMYHFAQTMEHGKCPYFYVFFNMQGSNMFLCNLSIQFFSLLCIIFAQTMKQDKYPFMSFSLLCIISHKPWSKVSVRTFMTFSTCKEVICFYAISLSIFCSLSCIIFAQTMEQDKYPYFYVFSTCKEVICSYVCFVLK